MSASFQSDASGRRISKSINGVTASFLYVGANVVQEQSAQLGTANLLSGGIDEIFTRGDLGGSFSPLADGLGSSLSLTDAAGTVQTEYAYGSFGLSASTGATSNNSSQYTGRENDGTGLYYYRARYYSPERQRFLSEDPLEFEGGDINLYAYVANSPTNFTDSFGLSAVTKVARIAKLLFGGGIKVEKGIGFKDASQVVKGGGDVIADNRKIAGEIAREAGGGKRPIHDAPHGPVEDGFRPHYHPSGRPGGHVFYGIGAILAPNSLALSGRSCTTNAQFASAVAWDLASGMDPTGLTDLINWAVGLD